MKEVARALITDEQGRVLLGKRAGGISEGLYTIIGGKFDEGENPVDAVKREVKEEIGLDFEPDEIFFEEEQEDDQSGKWKVFYFTGKASGELKLDKDEITDIIYISADEITRSDIAFNHEKILERFFNKISP